MSTPPLSGAFEPLAEEALRQEPTLNETEVPLISIAISLKRIADVFATLSTEGCNAYGETILPAITRAISDGIAGR